MRVEEAYEIWSGTYDHDRNLTRDLDEQITREILRESRFESILEIGCGTGKNTRWFSEIAERVQAIDFSPAMIDQARKKYAAENVTFILADVTKPWPVPDASVDLVTCNLVLEHINDLSFIFTEAARVLITSGRCFVSELHPFRQYQGVQARFEREDGTITIPAFVHHISEFFEAAAGGQLTLITMNEWWHVEDDGKPPRLISFMFRK